MQETIFDYQSGQKAKKIGMEAAEFSFSYGADPVSIARNCAVLLAKRNGSCTADDVTEYMMLGSDLTKQAIEMIREHPNSFGSAFKSPRLKFTGQVVESKRKERHGNMIKVWHYVG